MVSYYITESRGRYSIILDELSCDKPAVVISHDPNKESGQPRQYPAENLDPWQLLTAICDLHLEFPTEFDKYGEAITLDFCPLTERDYKDRVIKTMVNLSMLLNSQRTELLSHKRKADNLEMKIQRARGALS